VEPVCGERNCLGEEYRFLPMARLSVGFLPVDTTAPLHHSEGMRLTVNLENDLYALAKSLAKAEDCSISVAVNRLLRRSLSGAAKVPNTSVRSKRRNGLVISRGRKPITADIVLQIDAEDDEG
jgi:predicted DNA-binding ribbon-helix-helix protein